MKEEPQTKLAPMGLFHTPDHPREAWSWCDRLSGSERIVAFTAVMMMWNYFASRLPHETVEQFEVEFPLIEGGDK